MNEVDEFDGMVISDERAHILDAECWCRPHVIDVPSPVATTTRYHHVRVSRP